MEALGESLYDPDEPTAFDAAVLAQLQTAVHGALDRLTEREASVLAYRFGLTTGESLTQDQIGRIYGVTRERIRQIETKAFALREPAVRAGLRDCFDGHTDIDGGAADQEAEKGAPARVEKAKPAKTKPRKKPSGPAVEKWKIKWDLALTKLSTFVAREGHAWVPTKHVDSGHNLGAWINSQRNALRLGTITPERLAEIDAVDV